MSANVETMMYVREKPWHGLGTMVQEAPTSQDAIKLAELNWTVVSNPIYDASGNVISGYKANTRDKDNSILGIVSDRYKIVQNHEAFEFTDSLVEDSEMTYECAGSLRGGKQIWLLGKMPETKILNDKFEPYICFTNAHDGTGAIKVCMTPIRVVCQNTLNLALSEARRMWSTKHVGDLAGKLHEAKMTLGFANTYMNELAIQAEKFADTKISDTELEFFLNDLFPIDYTKDSERKINNMNQMKNNFLTCYMMNDIADYRGTQYGVINAVADMADHMAPARMTDTYQENNWGRIIVGHPLLDAAIKYLAAIRVAA